MGEKFDAFVDQHQSAAFSVSVDMDRRLVVVAVCDTMNTLFVHVRPEWVRGFVQSLNRACAFLEAGKQFGEAHPLAAGRDVNDESFARFARGLCGHVHEHGWTCSKPSGHTDMHSNGADRSWEK